MGAKFNTVCLHENMLSLLRVVPAPDGICLVQPNILKVCYMGSD